MISGSSGRILVEERCEATMRRLVEASSSSAFYCSDHEAGEPRQVAPAPVAHRPSRFNSNWLCRHSMRSADRSVLFLAAGFALGLHLYAGPSSLGITTQQAFFGFFAWCYLLP